jgi:hypothetical protein
MRCNDAFTTLRRTPALFLRSLGNWHASCADCMVALGLLSDDRGRYQRGLSLLRDTVTSYYKWGRGDWADGHLVGESTETFRDIYHSLFGLGSLVQAAEAAWGQDEDAYAAGGHALAAAMELHARAVNAWDARDERMLPGRWRLFGSMPPPPRGCVAVGRRGGAVGVVQLHQRREVLRHGRRGPLRAGRQVPANRIRNRVQPLCRPPRHAAARDRRAAGALPGGLAGVWMVGARPCLGGLGVGGGRRRSRGPGAGEGAEGARRSERGRGREFGCRSERYGACSSDLAARAPSLSPSRGPATLTHAGSAALLWRPGVGRRTLCKPGQGRPDPPEEQHSVPAPGPPQQQTQPQPQQEPQQERPQQQPPTAAPGIRVSFATPSVRLAVPTPLASLDLQLPQFKFDFGFSGR